MITEQYNGVALKGLALFSYIVVKDESNFEAWIVQLGVEPI